MVFIHYLCRLSCQADNTPLLNVYRRHLPIYSIVLICPICSIILIVELSSGIPHYNSQVLHLSGLYRLQLPGTAVRLLIISGGPSARIRYSQFPSAADIQSSTILFTIEL